MEIAQAFLLPYLIAYKFPALFLGSFFFGETVILSAVFFALESSWPLSQVFGISLIGVITADAVWFFAGRYFLTRSRRLQLLKEKNREFLEKMEHQSKRKQLLYLIFFKFFYGTRIITIVYIATHNMSFRRFLVFDLIGTTLWLSVLIALGWATWSGASRALDAFHHIGYILGAILFLVIFVKLITKWLSKKYTAEL